MKLFSPVPIVRLLITAIIAPLIVSLVWRGAAPACDTVAEVGLLLLAFMLPFCSSLHSNFLRVFGKVFGLGFAWGVWRMYYFDPVTRNDIPGIGYLIAPLMMGGFSATMFSVRKAISKRSSGGGHSGV